VEIVEIGLAVDIVAAVGSRRGKTVDITVVAAVGAGRGVVTQKACESCQGFPI
jgi:hypothetical protein